MAEHVNEIYDVVVVGGGPAGLCAAMSTARLKLKTLVLDASPNAGALWKAERVENYPGILQEASGIELAGNFRKQAEKYGAVIKTEKVYGVNFRNVPREITGAGGKYLCRAVVLATGSMSRAHSIPGESEFTGKGVSYCANCDAPFFKDMTVAVTGDLGEIFDDIDLISKFARKIYVISEDRNIPFAASEAFHCNSKLDMMYGYRVVKISGDTSVRAITVANAMKFERVLDVSGIFIYLHGKQPDVEFLEGAVHVSDDGCVIVNKEDMSTSLDGIFAAGDVICNKVRQVVVAAAEGSVAGMSAYRYINQMEKK